MPEIANEKSRAAMPSLRRISNAAPLALIAVYRWTIAPLIGVNCRHLPSCSDYAREAIEMNGAWRGGWLTLARLSRCHPFGSHGFDPVPDVRGEHHLLAPWRYGRWRAPSPDTDDSGSKSR
jgi:putative membrane protein insertion efficiency factor